MIDPVQVLKDAVQKAGSQKAFASNVGVSPQYVNDLMRGRRASLHTQGVFVCSVSAIVIPLWLRNVILHAPTFSREAVRLFVVQYVAEILGREAVRARDRLASNSRSQAGRALPCSWRRWRLSPPCISRARATDRRHHRSRLEPMTRAAR